MRRRCGHADHLDPTNVGLLDVACRCLLRRLLLLLLLLLRLGWLQGLIRAQRTTRVCCMRYRGLRISITITRLRVDRVSRLAGTRSCQAGHDDEGAAALSQRAGCRN